jgi:uncharacterized protein involved in exopolysaccharide biosynthesis
MKIIDLIRLIRKHIVLLIGAPLLAALVVILLTWRSDVVYTSNTTLYTGIASGSTVEMDKTINYSATSAAFDNLINVIKSRETLQEVSVRLLSQHLLLGKSDPKYISSKSYEELRKVTPKYIFDIVDNIDLNDSGINDNGFGNPADNNNWKGYVSDNEIYETEIPNLFPSTINKAVYERTVQKLTELMKSSDTNFVYALLNYEHPHYSVKALSALKVQRVGSSDLVKVDFESNDPGICQQTLAILNEVCIKNYRRIRETRSDDVMKYFETQVSQSAAILKTAEDKLLDFNRGKGFINYNEQSRSVATTKEELESQYNKDKAQLAGVEASIKRLEEKLGAQQQAQLKNTKILDMKKQLGNLIYQISSAEKSQTVTPAEKKRIDDLNRQASQLKSDIAREVDELYAYTKTTDGVQASAMTAEWINLVVEAESIKGRLLVMEEQIKNFKEQYASYVPAGANIKRIEREIAVAEQQFIENLHGLNLARLKLQDNEIASNIKTVDPPYFPLSPASSKRKLLVIAAAFFTGLVVLGSILAGEYFDDTLKNPGRASERLGLQFAGVFPKIFKNSEISNFRSVLNRLTDITVQNIELYLKNSLSQKKVKTILVFSTLRKEGKSVITGNIARKLISQGKKVLVLNYDEDTHEITDKASDSEHGKKSSDTVTLPFIYRLLGYPDPSIDYSNEFLREPAGYLPSGSYYSYKNNDDFLSVRNFYDILVKNGVNLNGDPDIVLIELPSILYNACPVDLITDADVQVLVCRSNRVWSDADKTAMKTFSALTKNEIHYVLNGVEINAVESVTGELPKERSLFRKKVKSLLTLQFTTSNQI